MGASLFETDFEIRFHTLAGPECPAPSRGLQAKKGRPESGPSLGRNAKEGRRHEAHRAVAKSVTRKPCAMRGFAIGGAMTLVWEQEDGTGMGSGACSVTTATLSERFIRLAIASARVMR